MTFESFKNYVELLSFFATITGAAALVWAYFSWRDGQQGLHHAVITSCSTRFQSLIDELADPNLTTTQARQYLDLCNEELFYFENNYLPRPVVIEWLDGMLYLLPLRYPSTLRDAPGPASINSASAADAAPFFNRPDLIQLLESYSRLDYVFTLRKNQAAVIRNATPENQRGQMLLALLANVSTYRAQSTYGKLTHKPWYKPW